MIEIRLGTCSRFYPSNEAVSRRPPFIDSPGTHNFRGEGRFLVKSAGRPGLGRRREEKLASS